MNRILYILATRTFLFNLKIFFALFLFSMPFYCLSDIKMVEHSENKLIFTADFAELRTLKSTHRLPLLKETFFILSDDKNITLKSLEKKYFDISLAASAEDLLIEDIPIGSEDTIVSPVTDLHHHKIFNYTSIGKYQGLNLIRVHISSFDFEQKKLLQQIEFEISGKGITFFPDSIFYSDLDILSKIQKEDTQKRIKKTTQSNYNIDDYILSGEKRLKIYITEEGIYRITGKSIEKAGWKISGAEIDYLKLIFKGREIPIRIIGSEDGTFDKNDIIEFWGEPIWSDNTEEKCLNIYTDQNIYWLFVGNNPGLRLGNQSAVLEQTNNQQKIYPVSYPYTIHNEENNVFNRLAYAQDVNTEDYWLYSRSINGDEKKEFIFKIDAPYLYSTNPVKMKFKLRGQCAQYGNHPVEFYLNDHYIGSTTWHNYDEISFTSNKSSPVHLKEYENKVTISNKSSSGLFAQLYLDWFKITYPREFITDSDFLLFNPPLTSENKIVHFELKGFSYSNVQIFKKHHSVIYNPDIKSVIDTLGNESFTLSFEDRIADESIQYLALTKSEISEPDSMVFLEHNDLRSSEFGADYVIITPVDSLGIENEDLQDLIAQRENQGLKVKVADLQNIYDEFDYGIPSPKAIKKFLHYAKLNWNPKPRFALLIGDGTIDYKIRKESGNLIPVPLYQSVNYGGTPSDYYYSLLTEDNFAPDIAIGRLPVKSKRELRDIIKKIIDYETNSRGPWRNDYLMISAGTRKGDFGYQAEYIINNIIEPSINPKRMYLSGSIDDPYLGGTEDLLRHFRNGTAWINFRGHGGGAIWSDGGLLDLDDIPLLENKGKLPFITSMTCFTGDFASRKKSLGESLLLKDRTGAVAFFGSTGLGWVWNDFYLLRELFQCYTLFPDYSIGELIDKAKSAYLLKYRSDLALSEAFQFLLLGDPALKLTFPGKTTDIKLASQAVRENNTVHIQGRANSSDLNVHLSITDSSYATRYSETLSLNENDWSFNIPVPEELYGSRCGIRAYLWDPENDYQIRGFSPFTYGTSFFDSLSVVPENPTFEDSIYFRVRIEDVNQIRNVYCILEQPESDTLTMYNVNNIYKTKKIPPFNPGTYIKFHCMIYNENEKITTSQSKEISIPLLADLRVHSIFLSGTDKVNISAELTNYGQTAVEDVIVQFSSEEQGFNASDTVSIPESGTIISSVTFYPRLGNNIITVTIDPDSLMNETSRMNNILTKEIMADRFWITPELGTTLNFISSDTVGIREKVLTYIPPDAVNKTTTVSFELLDKLPHYKAQKEITSEIYRINFPGLTKQLEHEVLFLFYRDTLNTCNPYIWNNDLYNWIRCDYQEFAQYIQVNSNIGGYFSFISSEDNNPPHIVIEVDNQAFVQGSYVPRQPLFNVLLQDDSAIDLRPAGINVTIDNIAIPYSDLMIPDSVTGLNDINISFKPELTPGEHYLQVEAKDVHGNNNTSAVFNFKVGDDLDIHYLGNHPNPFKTETVFVYVLTDVAKNVSLKIYTVSGKLIRKIADNTMASPDYHEIVWDGRDEWRNLVANGVYFFKLTVEGFSKTKEVTGKIAKIR